MSGDTLYLIDGHAQIFRAYFAIRGGMNSPVTGEPTQAVFGMAGMFLKLFLRFQPRYVAMAIDSPGKTFRDELFPAYKATRAPTPTDLRAQEERIFELTRLFGVPLLAQVGVEADDILATVTQRVLADPTHAQLQVRLVSRDKDLEQLLGDRVAMFDIHTDATFDTRRLKEEKGITPAQVVDMLTLMGDTVDNVPGVAGVGPKTAAALIQEFGSVENLLANLDKVKGKRRENLEQARPLLPLARQLVTLKRDVAIDFDLETARVRPPDAAGLRHFFQQMGFRRHQADLERLLAGSGPELELPRSPAPPVPAADAPAGGVAEARGEAAALEAGAHASPGAADPLPFAASLFEAETFTAAAPGTSAVARPPTAPLPPGFSSGSDQGYRAITTRQELDHLLAVLRTAPLIAVDTETIGLGRTAALCGVSLAWAPGCDGAVYIPLRSPKPETHLDAATVLPALAEVLSDPARPKCGHNLKYDWLVLRHAGLELRGIVFDSMIASHLLGSAAHGLDYLAETLLKHRMIPISDLLGPEPGGPRKAGGRTMDQAPLDLITRYAADDAEVSLRLQQTMSPQLRVMGLAELAERVEMPLVEVLAEMEHHGIRVDPAILAEQKRDLAGRIEVLRDRIHEAAGTAFNLDSPKQLGEVLFKKLGLPAMRRTKSGPSTDVEVLEKLADLDNLSRQQALVPQLIVEYRQLAKLVGTYLDSLREAIDPATGRIHATFHQGGAATGRLSSSNPNLQNIPIRSEQGRQIRKAFVAAAGPPEHLLVCADYSQIELRILAHLSRDPALCAAFEADQDIHAAVAAQVFGVPLDQVSKEQRGHAKVINFGIIYGVTPYGLARRIDGLEVEGARKLISDYRRRFAGIDAFLDKCVQQAEELGYVTTMMGRRRPVPQVRAGSSNQRAFGERLAINSVVQGSAADLMKLAMVNLHRRIQRERLPLRMLLQIHDELVLEAPAAEAPAMAAIVRQEMEQAQALRIPLKAEAGVGINWLEAK